MTDSTGSSIVFEMSEQERARIRAEVRYTMIAAEELRTPSAPKSRFSKFIEFLSSGISLLVVGSIISSLLIPSFQREYENRSKALTLMQDCLSQFLQYSNSIWQEYYAVLPLTQKVEIDEKTYLEYVGKIADIKLKRYDAYAKIVALSVVFGDRKHPSESDVDKALKSYAIRINEVSAAIDKWLTGLYCTPTDRIRSPCAQFDPRFDAYNEHLKIKQLVVNMGNKETDDVASLIVKHISQP